MLSLTSSATHSPHVLVVDADSALRGILSTILTDEGYFVQTVGDGRAALAVMRASGARLLVMLGLRLPHVSGLEVLEAIAADPAFALRHTIVVMTGAVEQATHGRTKDLRDRLAIALLAKPFSIQQFLDAVAVGVAAA